MTQSDNGIPKSHQNKWSKVTGINMDTFKNSKQITDLKVKCKTKFQMKIYEKNLWKLCCLGEEFLGMKAKA